MRRCASSMPRKYVFKTTTAFRTALTKLTPRQKASARMPSASSRIILLTLACEPTRFTAYLPSFAAQSIPSPSKSIWVPIFYVYGDLVVSLDIGDHAIYRNDHGRLRNIQRTTFLSSVPAAPACARRLRHPRRRFRRDGLQMSSRQSAHGHGRRRHRGRAGQC